VNIALKIVIGELIIVAVLVLADRRLAKPA
jgi:hypothetical protein